MHVHIRGETVARGQGHEQGLLRCFAQWCLQGFDRKARGGKQQSVGGLGRAHSHVERGECGQEYNRPVHAVPFYFDKRTSQRPPPGREAIT